MLARRRWRADVLRESPCGRDEMPVHSRIEAQTSVFQTVPPTPWLRRLRDAAASESDAGRREMSLYDREASSQERPVSALGRSTAEASIHNRVVSSSESATVANANAPSSDNDCARSSPLPGRPGSAKAEPRPRGQPKRRCVPKPKVQSPTETFPKMGTL